MSGKTLIYKGEILSLYGIINEMIVSLILSIVYLMYEITANTRNWEQQNSANNKWEWGYYDYINDTQVSHQVIQSFDKNIRFWFMAEVTITEYVFLTDFSN